MGGENGRENLASRRSKRFAYSEIILICCLIKTIIDFSSPNFDLINKLRRITFLRATVSYCRRLLQRRHSFTLRAYDKWIL
ncbi:hypothetical protein C7534_102324 [Pseudomonas sp. OV226]|nr:hypothetical protein C7534_102324 [Pseudomonas sp. OV226]